MYLYQLFSKLQSESPGGFRQAFPYWENEFVSTCYAQNHFILQVFRKNKPVTTVFHRATVIFTDIEQIKQPPLMWYFLYRYDLFLAKQDQKMFK